MTIFSFGVDYFAWKAWLGKTYPKAKVANRYDRAMRLEPRRRYTPCNAEALYRRTGVREKALQHRLDRGTGSQLRLGVQESTMAQIGLLRLPGTKYRSADPMEDPLCSRPLAGTRSRAQHRREASQVGEGPIRPRRMLWVSVTLRIENYLERMHTTAKVEYAHRQRASYNVWGTEAQEFTEVQVATEVRRV